MVTENREFANQVNRAADTFQRTLEAGMRLQGEALRFWGNACNFNNVAQDTRQLVERFADEWLPLMQKNVEACTRVLDDQVQTGVNFVQQALEAAPALGNAEMQRRARDLWSTTVDAMRSQADAFNRVNAQAVENFSNFVHEAFSAAEGMR